jgi:urea carboxylase
VAQRVPAGDAPRALVEPSPLARRAGPLCAGILLQRPARGDAPELTCRQSGDRYLLVEHGPMVLDLDLRVRVQLLWSALREEVARGELRGVVDLTPGVRSLQIHFEPGVLARDRLLERVARIDEQLSAADAPALPTRIVHLPLCWEDPEALRAIEKYMAVVRDDAPWCPSNIEFIRRVNGLDSVDDVRRIVFDASYLVLGLGDVYLGAPVATPLDPRHRLVTTKYNPARTWTPENAVGIGGAYLCIYGMEGPGGYQLFGRTVPVWSTHARWRGAAAGEPWLLRFFDQIRFFPVSAEELLAYRRELRDGRRALRIEPGHFELAAHRRFLESIRGDSERFRQTQRAAFQAERERWVAAGEFAAAARSERASLFAADVPEIDLPEGSEAVSSPLGAQLWRVCVAEGQRVSAGQELAVLAAMKTETAVAAPRDGVIERVLCAEGQIVAPGAPLFALRAAS